MKIVLKINFVKTARVIDNLQKERYNRNSVREKVGLFYTEKRFVFLLFVCT